MTVPQTQEEAGDAFREMDEYLSNPIATISEFYTLMYLDEIKEVDEISFDYFDLKTTLDDVLYNYAVYVSSAELTHYGQKFRIDGIRAQMVADGYQSMNQRIDHYMREYGYDQQQAEKEAEKELQDRKDKLTEAINSVADDRKTRGTIRTIMNLNRWPEDKGNSATTAEEAIERLVRNWSAFGRDSTFLDAAKIIFGHKWASTMNARDTTGWSSSYGGRAWANVCETAQRKWEMGRTAFIDLMFSVEHNNGNFLNKWYKINDKDIMWFLQSSDLSVAERAGMGQPKEIIEETNERKVFIEIVPKLLTMARNENLGQMADIAARKNRNIRKYKSMVPRGDQEIVFDGSDYVFH